MDKSRNRYNKKFEKNSKPYGAPKAKTPKEPREELSENVIIGRNAVRELLNGNRDVEKIYISDGIKEGSINQLIGIAGERGIPIFECERTKLDSISHGQKHQGIIAIAAEHNYSSIDEIIEYAKSLGEKPLIAICDGVEDPHNLGAIIRSAECSGFHGVIIPKRRAVGLTATVAKASAGALMHMRIAKVTNISMAIDELKEKGFWIYAADMDGTDYHSTDMRGSLAIVLGSEGAGISRLVKEKCDFVVSIPLYGHVNSMNVSCAAAVLFAEAARQRHIQEV